MLSQYPLAYSFCCAQNNLVGDIASERCGEHDHRGHVVRPLVGDGASHDTAQAMAYQMDLAASLHARPVYAFVESPLDQQIRALGIQTDAGKVGTVTNPFQPVTQLCQIGIGAQEAGNKNNPGTIAVRNTKAI